MPKIFEIKNKQAIATNIQSLIWTLGFLTLKMASNPVLAREIPELA
ncbi:MAG: hypothetical protein F6K40_32940 [Okeania sp. SIO3I5]|nr:hypothetical protein [Okeania sp. SIO3I5]NEQ40770.1 hypothetical protein [Okeania sp. SIO3I5]